MTTPRRKTTTTTTFSLLFACVSEFILGCFLLPSHTFAFPFYLSLSPSLFLLPSFLLSFSLLLVAPFVSVPCSSSRRSHVFSITYTACAPVVCESVFIFSPQVPFLVAVLAVAPTIFLC